MEGSLLPGSEALPAWDLNFPAMLLLAVLGAVYIRGWLRAKAAPQYLVAFTAGLFILFLALQSPIDTFAERYLWVHMTQHVLLLSAAPLLIVFARARGLLVRGLPSVFVKRTVSPVLKWPPLSFFTGRLTSPVVSLIAFLTVMLFWHLPRFYQLALGDGEWHDLQHACFFWAGILFWIPVIEGNPRAPRWFAIPYLLVADLLNTAFSAFLMFSGRLLYPAYVTLRAGGMSPAQDQIVAGAVMWVPGSIFFLIPAIVMAYRFAAPPFSAQVGLSPSQGI